MVSAGSASSAGGVNQHVRWVWHDDLLMRFFLFFLTSTTVAGPFDMAIRASVVDLGRAVGSEGIVGLESSGSREGVGGW